MAELNSFFHPIWQVLVSFGINYFGILPSLNLYSSYVGASFLLGKIGTLYQVHFLYWSIGNPKEQFDVTNTHLSSSSFVLISLAHSIVIVQTCPPTPTILLSSIAAPTILVESPSHEERKGASLFPGGTIVAATLSTRSLKSLCDRTRFVCKIHTWHMLRLAIPSTQVLPCSTSCASKVCVTWSKDSVATRKQHMPAQRDSL